MDEVHHEHEGDPSFWAPGTITLEDCKGRLKNIYMIIRICANHPKTQ